MGCTCEILSGEQSLRAAGSGSDGSEQDLELGDWEFTRLVRHMSTKQISSKDIVYWGILVGTTT